MGKRFKGSVHQVQVVEESSEEDENPDEDARSTRAGGANNQASEDEDYFDEQYPPVEDKYKQLEDMLKAVEIQVVPGLDFGDLGLVSGIVIPTSSRFQFLPSTMVFHARSFI